MYSVLPVVEAGPGPGLSQRSEDEIVDVSLEAPAHPRVGLGDVEVPEELGGGLGDGGGVEGDDGESGRPHPELEAP